MISFTVTFKFFNIFWYKGKDFAYESSNEMSAIKSLFKFVSLKFYYFNSVFFSFELIVNGRIYKYLFKNY